MSEATSSARGRDVYREITDKIVAAIQIGAPEFQMPWHRSVASGRPVNAYTDFAYRGVNVVALWTATEFGHFTSRYWATYKQWQMLGARIREGERGSIIVFFKETTRQAYDEKEGEMVPETYLVARSSFVFNANQVDGWETPEIPAKSQVEIIEEAERFATGTKADIRHGGDQACYRPSGDFVQIPDRERFVGSKTSNPTECYYATLLHELTHWTGHKSRLDRDLANRFGDQAYAMEELVAELGAAFLCGDLRITNSPRLDHASYIASWLKL
jgi:antirestriction protein ArdC